MKLYYKILNLDNFILIENFDINDDEELEEEEENDDDDDNNDEGYNSDEDGDNDDEDDEDLEYSNSNINLIDGLKKLFNFICRIFEYFIGILLFIFSKKFIEFLKESYNFRGKIGRKQLLKRLIGGFLLFFGISGILLELEFSTTISNIIGYPILLFYIIFAISNLVKRYNDFGKNKWYLILLIIPYINLVFLGFLLLKKGEDY